MRIDTHRKYVALQCVSGAENEAKRKRFFVYYNNGFLENSLKLLGFFVQYF